MPNRRTDAAPTPSVQSAGCCPKISHLQREGGRRGSSPWHLPHPAWPGTTQRHLAERWPGRPWECLTRCLLSLMPPGSTRPLQAAIWTDLPGWPGLSYCSLGRDNPLYALFPSCTSLLETSLRHRPFLLPFTIVVVNFLCLLPRAAVPFWRLAHSLVMLHSTLYVLKGSFSPSVENWTKGCSLM